MSSANGAFAGRSGLNGVSAAIVSTGVLGWSEDYYHSCRPAAMTFGGEKIEWVTSPAPMERVLPHTGSRPGVHRDSWSTANLAPGLAFALACFGSDKADETRIAV